MRKEKIKGKDEMENKEKGEKGKSEKKVSEEKIKTVKKLAELIKNNNTIIIVSIKNLPSRQFQDIRKKLKGIAEVKVVKKNIILKAIETSQDKKIEKLKNYVCEDSAILFSKEDAFVLAGFLAENKNSIKAKTGQIAMEDIEAGEGATDLTPGPAISEFGNLGIKIAIEDGKIVIKGKKVIVKKGEKINESAASIMAKLDIKPFKIGLEPLAIYDAKTSKVYTDIKIDKEKTAQEIKISAVKALGFAQKIIYYCKETIGFLIRKANAEEKVLERLEKNVEQPKENQAQQNLNNQEEK